MSKQNRSRHQRSSATSRCRNRRRCALGFEHLERRALLAFSAIGAEFGVNTFTTNNQTFPATAMDADGDFVVVWQSSGQDGTFPSIYAQRYNAAGVAQGIEFRVNTTIPGSQAYPAVAMDATGDFVVAWQTVSLDGSGYGIYARRYDSVGRALSHEFKVNTTTDNAQQYPSIAMDVDGDYVIAWESFGQDGSGYGIYAQRFNADSVAQGNEFRVNSTTTNQQRLPIAAMDDSGNFVITWYGDDGTGNTDIYAQRFDANGQMRGGEFRVNTTTAFAQSTAAVDMDADGDFVISWQSDRQDGSAYGIYAQRFAANGSTLGGEFRVNTTTTSSQHTTNIAMDADGDFIVVWNANDTQLTYGIYARKFSAGGTATSAEIRINTQTTGQQTVPSVSMDSDGDFVVAWASNGQDGSSDGIYAQRFNESTSEAGPIVATIRDGHRRVEPGGRLNSSVRRLTVEFSELMNSVDSPTGANSVRNVANWRLTRDGLDATSSIASVNFALNDQTQKPEAELFFTGTLPDGTYRLTLLDTVRSSLGNMLDGDHNGTPGGSFSHNFSIFSAQPIGGEVSPNSSPIWGLFPTPPIAMDADGDYVVAWVSYNQDGSGGGVYAQRYASDGMPQGGEFRVNTTTALGQITPAIAMADDGRFVIVWASYQNGNNRDIYAQRYSASGTPLGSEFLVNTNRTLDQAFPAIAMDNNGGFVIAWQSETAASETWIEAQRYDSQGRRLGTQFPVGESQVLGFPAAAMNSHGNFVISWNPKLGGTAAQLFAAGGGRIGSEIQVSPKLTFGWQSKVAMDDIGNFVVTWNGSKQSTGNSDIYAQRFNALGQRQSEEILVNTQVSFGQSQPNIAMDPDGDFVITWVNDDDRQSINGQKFDESGLRHGSEFRVNSTLTGFQLSPAIALSHTGDFAVSWAAGGDVRIQRFRVNEPVQAHGQLRINGTNRDNAIDVSLIAPSGMPAYLQTTYDGVKYKSATTKVNSITMEGHGGHDRLSISPDVYVSATLNGGDGNDVLRGGLGNDSLVGGLGDDLYQFDLDFVQLVPTLTLDSVVDVGGIDTLDFTDTTTRGLSVNLSLTQQTVTPKFLLFLSSGASIENLIGGPLDDQLTGNTLANQLTGGPGDDMLNAGAGNDVYRFDTDLSLGKDTVSDPSGLDTLDFAATSTRSIVVNLSLSTEQTINTGLKLVLASGNIIENVRGGSGDDILIGNALANTLSGLGGNDVLSGLAGNDTLHAGDGRNILIGGIGADTLNGGSGEDLLIGATYTQQSHLAALRAIMAEWKSPVLYTTRIAHLRGTMTGGLNGTFLLNSSTIREDKVRDTLNGGLGRDWYFRNVRSALTTQHDVISDSDADSVFTEIDSWL